MTLPTRQVTMSAEALQTLQIAAITLACSHSFELFKTTFVPGRQQRSWGVLHFGDLKTSHASSKL
jgi:hypothetical protein